MPAKYKNANAQYASYDAPSSGSSFGGGDDLHIHNNSNVHAGYMEFPYSYQDTTGRRKLTFDGDRNFKVNAIEVFLPQWL